MPRGGYDCTGAAPGSFASRLGRQMYPCGGGNTPRASQAAVFPGSATPYQHAGGAGTYAHQGQVIGLPNGAGNYSYLGAATTQASFMAQQQPYQTHQASVYMAGPSFGPSQSQTQSFAHYGYSTIQMPVGAPAASGGVATSGMVYPGSQGLYHHQPQSSVYGAAQASYYRHP